MSSSPSPAMSPAEVTAAKRDWQRRHAGSIVADFGRVFRSHKLATSEDRHALDTISAAQWGSLFGSSIVMTKLHGQVTARYPSMLVKLISYVVGGIVVLQTSAFSSTFMRRRMLMQPQPQVAIASRAMYRIAFLFFLLFLLDFFFCCFLFFLSTIIFWSLHVVHRLSSVPRPR